MLLSGAGLYYSEWSGLLGSEDVRDKFNPLLNSYIGEKLDQELIHALRVELNHELETLFRRNLISKIPMFSICIYETTGTICIVDPQTALKLQAQNSTLKVY